MHRYILWNAAINIEVLDLELSHGEAQKCNNDLRTAGSSCRWILYKFDAIAD